MPIWPANSRWACDLGPPDNCSIALAGQWGSTDPGGDTRSGPGVPQRQRGVDRDMDTQAQSPDRSIPVRCHPRIRRQLASADNSAQTAASANALRILDRRTAPIVGSDLDPAHGAQSSSLSNVLHAAVAALRNRMRIGEALRLTVQDVDLTERIITVRCTKFFKTRLFRSDRSSPTNWPRTLNAAACCPCRSGKRRRSSHRAASEDGAIHASSRCSSTYDELLVSTAPSANPARRRLHDLRHTAAVHRVVAWYRTGQDVQRLLPQLAAYLGHLDIRSTQRYLQMTPELLQAASQRFAQYAMGDDHEG